MVNSNITEEAGKVGRGCFPSYPPMAKENRRHARKMQERSDRLNVVLAMNDVGWRGQQI